MDGKTSDQPDGRRAYFDALYANDADPWQYHSCDYEIAKRADTLRALPRPRYARACEIGCSIGVLTRDLAARCDSLLGIDISETAAAIARDAVKALPQVEIKVMHVPHVLPDGSFDLLMLSEVLYFLNRDELDLLAAFAAARVPPGGDVLIVSYDGETLTDLDGRAATDVFTTAMARDFEVINDVICPHYHRRLLRRLDA